MRAGSAILSLVLTLVGCADEREDACERTCRTDGPGVVLSTQVIDSEGEASADAVALLPDGDLVVLGIAGNSAVGAVFGPLELGPGEHMFVARVRPDGAVRWATAFDGADIDAARLAVDGAGQVYVGGTFRGTVRLGADEFVDATMDDDGFVACLGVDGSVRWARTVEGNTARISDLEKRAAGVTIVGEVLGPTTFGETALASGGFVVDLDEDGEVRWARSITASGLASAKAITTGADGTLWIVGRGLGGLDLGDGVERPAPGLQWFLARLAAADGALLDAAMHPGHIDIADLSGDLQGGLALAGAVQEALALGPASLPAPANETPFIAAFAPDGAARWAAHLEVDAITSLAVGATGVVAVQGYHSGAPMLGPTEPAEPAACPVGDRFVGSPAYIVVHEPDGAHRWSEATQLRSGSVTIDGDEVLLAGGQVHDLWLSGCFHPLQDLSDAVVIRFRL